MPDMLTDERTELLRELVKQQRIANVIAALSCHRRPLDMDGDLAEVAERFVFQSVSDIVRSHAPGE